MVQVQLQFTSPTSDRVDMFTKVLEGLGNLKSVERKAAVAVYKRMTSGVRMKYVLNQKRGFRITSPVKQKSVSFFLKVPKAWTSGKEVTAGFGGLW